MVVSLRPVLPLSTAGIPDTCGLGCAFSAPVTTHSGDDTESWSVHRCSNAQQCSSYKSTRSVRSHLFSEVPCQMQEKRRLSSADLVLFYLRYKMHLFIILQRRVVQRNRVVVPACPSQKAYIWMNK